MLARVHGAALQKDGTAHVLPRVMSTAPLTSLLGPSRCPHRRAGFPLLFHFGFKTEYMTQPQDLTKCISKHSFTYRAWFTNMLEVHVGFTRATETLNNIKSSYIQNRLKYSSNSIERKVRNVRGHLTYKEVASAEHFIS